MKRRRIPFWAIGFIVCIICVQGFYFQRNFKIISERPSEKWEKSIEIGEGNVDGILDFLEREDYLVLVHGDGERVILKKLDKDGTIIKENFFDINKEDYGFYLTKKGKDNYLTWRSYINEETLVKSGRIDENLNIVEVESLQGFGSVTKVSEKSVLIYGPKKAGIYVPGEGLVVNEEIPKSRFFSGAEYNGEFYINYYETKERCFITRVYKDGILEEEIKSGAISLRNNDKLDYKVLDVNDKKVSVIYDKYVKGFYEGTFIVYTDRVDGNSEKKHFMYQGSYVKKNKKIDNGKLSGIINHVKDGREIFRDGIEFQLEDERVKSYNRISNTDKSTLFSAISGDYAVFADFEGEDLLSVKLTSDKNVIKHNEESEKKYEESYSLKLTLKDMINSFLNFFMFGWVWLVPILMIFGVNFFIDDSIKEGNRGKAIFVIGIICTICELMVLKSWKARATRAMPEVFTSGFSTGITVFTIVFMSLIIISSYKKYVNREEDVPLASLLGKVIMQEFIMLNIFIPFIT